MFTLKGIIVYQTAKLSLKIISKNCLFRFDFACVGSNKHVTCYAPNNILRVRLLAQKVRLIFGSLHVTCHQTDEKRNFTGWPHSTSCEIPCVYNLFLCFTCKDEHILFSKWPPPPVMHHNLT